MGIRNSSLFLLSFQLLSFVKFMCTTQNVYGKRHLSVPFTPSQPLPPPMYKIPEPVVEVYENGGFRVSIPDEDGIRKMTFHGSVNVPLNSMDPGQIIGDVFTKSPVTGRWTYENRNVKLKRGDVLYFWVHVLKYNLGYMRTNLKYVVYEFTIDNNLQPEYWAMPEDVADLNESLDVCMTIVDNTIDSLALAQRELRRLRRAYIELKYRKDSTDTKTEIYSHPLVIGGNLPKITDNNEHQMLQFIEYIFRERLRIYDIRVRTVSEQKDGTWLFDLNSTGDKQRILEAAQVFLVKSNIFIKNFQRA